MIIIPMAGNSRRFFEAGFTRPKYELPVFGESLFALTARSFEKYFATERFVFVCRSDLGGEPFVRAECEMLGIKNFDIVVLSTVTRGQAETVLLGMENAGFHESESLLIFNIDTIRLGWVFPQEHDLADGYLEVFHGDGDNWSFVKPAAPFSSRVAFTTEKERISDLCSSGLYYFSRAGDFAKVCREALANIESFKARWRELYVAPLYNELITAGKTITYHVVPAEDIGFSGTPAEYQALLANGRPS
jgi:hypothetical protein